MAKKNLILGVVTGVALLSITAFVLYRKRRSGSSVDAERPFGNLIHDGKRLANKSRRKAEHLMASASKQS